MSIERPTPRENETSGAKVLAAIAVVLFAVLSLAPSYFSPLNSFVPGPFFLRSHQAASALPFQIGTAVLYGAVSFFAAWKKSSGLAILAIVAAPAMALLTFVRLLFAGGLSGGI